MKALLVMVHGSPRPESNDDVREVVSLLRGRARFPIVEIGFLDVNRPTIPEAVAQCVSEGASSIVAVPYFLHTGKHVTRDLPDVLAECAKLYPLVEISMGGYIGSSELIRDVLIDRIRDARESQ